MNHPDPDSDYDPDIADHIESRTWSRRAQKIAAVIWASFLAASGATMLFFAWVDPPNLGLATSPPIEFSRMTGYAFGFFFFWMLALFSAGLSAYLISRTNRVSKEQ